MSEYSQHLNGGGLNVARDFDESARIYPRVDLREAVRRDIERGCGKELAAAAIGVGGSQQVNNYTCSTKRGFMVADHNGCNRYQSDGASMSLDQFELLLGHLRPLSVAHEIAAAAGGVFVPGVESDVSPRSAMEEMSVLLTDLGALVLEVEGAIEDRRVSRSEWSAVQRQHVKAAAQLNRLVQLAAVLRG